MNEFEFWQKWGLQLNEKQFANAFLALGIVAQTNIKRNPDSSEDSLNDILKKVTGLSKGKDSMIPWHFPERHQKIKIGDEIVFLSDLDPLEVGNAWKEVTKQSGFSCRIQVLHYPKKEEIRPWFRLLENALTYRSAVHIDLGMNRWQPYLQWPLRLGYFPGNAAEKIIHGANFFWPSNELTRIMPIDRENANCDVLLYSGNSGQLFKTLLEIPVPQKTNLIIIRGTSHEDVNLMYQRLISIIEECYASGIIIINTSVTDDDLEHAINRFVENLSHNEPFDVAVFEAFTKSYSFNPVIFLNKKLALFQIQNIIRKLQSKLKHLSKSARPEIKLESFRKMGIPAKDSERDDLRVPGNAADRLKEYKEKIIFEHESSGASGMVEMDKAIESSASETLNEKSVQRSLRKQILINKEGKLVKINRVFYRDIPTLIQISIGPPDKEWDSLSTVFPVEKLPKDIDEWRLTVVLTEPNHLKEALRKTIKLPRVGCSDVCEFRVELKENKPFEGRIIVMHRGRVLQTAILKGRVVSDDIEIIEDDNISFTDIVQVRSNLSDLEGRHQFDLAFVLNHTTDGCPHLTGISDNHAWLSDLSESETIINKISTKLTDAANQEKDYRGGLENRKNVDLLIELARIGRELYGSIVLGQLMDAANQSDFAKLEYIQIVSTKIDALAPLEFIYTAPAPEHQATLCPSIETVLKEKDVDTRKIRMEELIKETCQRVDKNDVKCKYRAKDHVCPMSFWGLSKVIERHMVTPALASLGYEFFLQSEKTSFRDKLDISGTAIIAASTNVKPEMLSLVFSACANRLGSPPIEAKDWDDWVKLVEDISPHVLLALPHTEGNGEDTTLEINGKTLASADMTPSYVHKEDEKISPLVALLGCDTAGTAIDYGGHVKWFRLYGAAVVISTIAKVFGDHAALVAKQLIYGLTREKNRPECLGEIIREIKRNTLIEGPLMALCVVAFGDADWKIN
jgi:hypothetical protein